MKNIYGWLKFKKSEVSFPCSKIESGFCTSYKNYETSYSCLEIHGYPV